MSKKEKAKAHFKERLREQMARRNLNQQQLAELVGVNQTSISRWLKGSLPYDRHIEVLAKHLGVSYKWLFSGKIDEYEDLTVGDYIAKTRTGLLARWGKVIQTLNELREKELPETERLEIDAMLAKIKVRYRMLLGTVHILEDEDPSESLYSKPNWKKPKRAENLLPVILENKTRDPLERCADAASMEKYVMKIIRVWLDGLSVESARAFLSELLYEGEILIEKHNGAEKKSAAA